MEYHIKEVDVYGMLNCLGFHHIGNHNRSYFEFMCDCGNVKVILGSLVKSGNTKSCGCSKKKLSRERKLLPNNLGMTRLIILGYKRHAKERNISWNLSEEEVIEIINKNCYYCDLIPSNVKTPKNKIDAFNYSGIDRVDSSLGYIKENCVPCCEQCNKSKMALKKEDFLSWIERVYKYSILNK